MTLKDLPSNVLKLALKEAKLQNSFPNLNTKLVSYKAFNWRLSIDGYTFWENIDDKNYTRFIYKYGPLADIDNYSII
jgi:hypothetical protein